MSSTAHPWEEIYRKEGRVLPEPFPILGEAVDAFRAHGCSLVLDIGCGSGRHVVHLAKEGFRALGLDISPTGLHLAQAWMREEEYEPVFALGDTRQPLPLCDCSIDGVLSTQVIHHARIAAVRLAIREIWRVLVPGGLALVTVSGRKDPGLEFEEIEPCTFVPLSGPEAGLAHHIFTVEEIESEFREYQILDLSVRAEGAVLAVMGRKP